jgi:hypothetical protein
MTAANKPLRAPAPPAGLEEETEMLREAIHQLYEQVIQSSDLSTAARALQALSAAMGRLSQLTEGQAQEEQANDGVEAAFWKAFAETIQELRGREQRR